MGWILRQLTKYVKLWVCEGGKGDVENLLMTFSNFHKSVTWGTIFAIVNSRLRSAERIVRLHISSVFLLRKGELLERLVLHLSHNEDP